MKGIIIYDGQYGSTKQYASWLGDELGISVIDSRKNGDLDLSGYDTVIIGSSISGGSLRAKKWITRRWNDLSRKNIHLFSVSGTPPVRIEQLSACVSRGIGTDRFNAVQYYPLHGRMAFGKLPFHIRLLMRGVAMLQKNPNARKGMTTSYDHVKKENLKPIIDGVRGV